MAGSLIKIDEEIVSSAVATVDLGGANWDSSYDVYKVVIHNVAPANDNVNFGIRFLISSSADSTANYDEAAKFLDSTTSFGTKSNTNVTGFTDAIAIGNGTSEMINATYYLFNFNNSSEYSFYTQEQTTLTYLAGNTGYMGGGVLTKASATNGLQFYFASGNIASGTFTLYGLKK